MATDQTSEAQMQKTRKKKRKDGLNIGLEIHLGRGRQRSHRYRGHRANSFVPSSDIPLLVELRARHRTFQGAYSRTALGNLGYALTILRLFDTRFYRIGLIFAILGGLLLLISFARDRHSRHDFADPRVNEQDEEDEEEGEEEAETRGGGTVTPGAKTRKPGLMGRLSGSFSSLSRLRLRRRAPLPNYSSSTPAARVFGRPFVTAGWIVIAVASVVLVAEIGLMVLIVKL